MIATSYHRCHCGAACNGHSAPSQGIGRDVYGWPLVYSDTGTGTWTSSIDFLLLELEDWRKKLWRTPEPDPLEPAVIEPRGHLPGARQWMLPAVAVSLRSKVRRVARGAYWERQAA